MSPKTKFLVFVIFIGVVVILLLNLIDIPFRPGYTVLTLAIVVVLYALLTRIADKLRHRKIRICSRLNISTIQSAVQNNKFVVLYEPRERKFKAEPKEHLGARALII